MKKFVLAIAIVAFLSCNNDAGTAEGTDTSALNGGDTTTLVTPDTSLSHDSMSTMTPDTTSE